MPEVYANNARAILSASITETDTTLPVEAGHSMPSLSGGEWFRATPYRTQSTTQGLEERDHEVVKVTAVGDTELTVERGLEGDPRGFDAETRVELRWTAAGIEALRQDYRLLSGLWASYYATYAPDLDLGEIKAGAPFSLEEVEHRISLSQGNSSIDLGGID